MSEAALKALCRETKALIVVSEYEARRMPMFQLRAVLNAIIVSEEEKKLIVDLVERDLRATGYPPAEIMAFLDDLIHVPPPVAKPAELPDPVQGTRRLRSPFAMGFETAGPAVSNEAEKVALRGPVFSVLRRGPAAQAGEPPIAQPPAAAGFTPAMNAAPVVSPSAVPLGTIPKAGTATPATGTRRSTFLFEASAAAPVGTPLSAPPGGLPGIAPLPPGASSANTIAPPGTKAWRQELVFGKSAPNVQPTGAASRQVILLADDDKRIRMVFRLRIEEAGFSVVECDNGTEAWERVQRGDVALAILDMKMPGLHGLEVLSNMQDKQMNIPVIICSAYDQLQDEFVVKSHTKLRYLVKPVAPDSLVSAIRELLKS